MTYKVGSRRLLYEDKKRLSWDDKHPRPLVTDIWYPAASTAVEVDVFMGPPDMPFFNVGKASHDADLVLTSARFPLVLLSHGTGGLSLQLGWLATYLASQGYIVAAVNHHGNNGLEPYMPQGFLRYWERPKDLTIVLNQLLVDPIFGSYIDQNRIGAAGFSLGGYTVIALAGGVTNIRLLIEDFRKLGADIDKAIPPEFTDHAAFMKEFDSLVGQESVANASYRDERVKAVFAIAPVLGPAFSPQGFSFIDIPIKIVVGEADQLAPASANASYFANQIRNSELTILEKVSHYTFLAEATDAGKRELPIFCVDADGVNRASVHQEVSEWALKFFEKHLKG